MASHVQHALLSQSIAQKMPYCQDTIHCQIIAAASQHAKPANAPAVRGPAGLGNRELSYKDLLDHAFSVALMLGERTPDSYVGVFMPRDVDYVVCQLGVMISGSAYLPLSSTVPEERIAYILEDSACDTVITTEDYAPMLGCFNGTTLLFSSIQRVEADAGRMEQMSAKTKASNLAYAIYTSGTTGKPKGVEVEHLGVSNMLQHHRDTTFKDCQEQLERCVLVAAFIFDSSVREIFLPLTAGRCLCIAQDVLNVTEGSCTGGTPSGLAATILPSSMRAALVGGERLTPACVKKLHKLEQIVNVYGPTETTVECTTHLTDPNKPDEIPLIGKPITNVNAYAVNIETLQVVSKGEQGELWISGPGIARGYRNREELNRNKFITDPFIEAGDTASPTRLFRTGDLVRWMESGDIEFLGRTDSQVKIRGYRIELEEVERVCAETPGVHNACVVVTKSPKDQDEIVVYVEPPPDNAESVRDHCSSKMPPYMVPKKVVGVESFELTPNGKIDKRRLPPVCWEVTPASVDNLVLPATEMEQQIVDLLEEAFGEQFSTDAHFFADIGMQSLEGALVVSELRLQGIELSGAAEILANPTVQKLAKRCEEILSGGEREINIRRTKLSMHSVKDVSVAKDRPLPRCIQWPVYVLMFFLMVLLCYGPPAALTTLIITQAHSRWGIYGTLGALPVVFCAVTPAVPFIAVLVKWLVLGRCRPGAYAVGGWFYIRWWFVNGFLTTTNAFILGIWRNTFALNWYCRAMGMKIGRDVRIDTAAILEPDLISIGDGCFIQSDALLSAHRLICLGEGNQQLLMLAAVQIESGVWVGPGATISPKDSEPLVVSASLPALASTQQMPEDFAQNQEQYLWQPAVGVPGAIFAFLLLVIMHTLALAPTVVLFYYMFLWQSKTNGWYALWLLNFFWTSGFPYMLLVIAYKWIVIGRFKEGPSTPSLDYRRFQLQMMLQSRLLTAIITLGASSPVITNFYRLLGAKIGWNAQVMPATLVEFDLVSIGDCVSFGGLVSFFPRDRAGNMRRIEIGNYSAVTNSAVVMAGAQVGESCIIGNLTLCPADARIPRGTKCVGSPMIQFKDDVVASPVLNRTRSNLVMFAHLVLSYCVELVDVPGWLFWFYVPLGRSTTTVGYVAEAFLVLPILTCFILITVILSRRFLSPKYVGEHPRDSWVFVCFIYFTKCQMSTDAHIYRLLNGSPLMPLVYKLMGGNISTTSLLFFRHCADFDQLTIADNAIVSFDSYLELHQKTAFELMYDDVILDTACMLGHRSICLRGTIVGPRASVSASCSVLPGDEILAGAVVTMNPGRMVGNSDPEPEKHEVAQEAQPSSDGTVDKSDHAASQDAPVPAPKARRQSVASVASRLSRISRQSASRAARRRSLVARSAPSDELLDHIVVGAGVCGLMAAAEISKQGMKCIVLEKTQHVMGCWRSAANSTSHVAVCEPAYRFEHGSGSAPPSDFTSRDEILYEGELFVSHNKIKITYGAEVTNIQRKEDIWEVSYVEDGETYTIRSKGVFVALGAQQTPRTLKYDNEEDFKGTICYGIKDQMPLEKYQGASVCIVGSGAFAMENVRTALLHGASHVTLIYRRSIQCWPRVLHYLATLGDTTLGELSKTYYEAVRWAGLEGKVEDFMSLQCTAQPTASDIFFLAYKTGRLTLQKGEVNKVLSEGVQLKDGQVIDCSVLLKCVGWQEPALSKIYPDFQVRQFCFLDGHASIAFVTDPHYQHRARGGKMKLDLAETPVKGGTFSVPAFAHASIRLQLHFMRFPEDFTKAMAQLPQSPHAVCSWFEQKWEFKDLPRVNEVIDDTLSIYKNRTKSKFPDLAAYLAMAERKYHVDVLRAWGTHMPYIFNMNGTANQQPLGSVAPASAQRESLPTLLSKEEEQAKDKEKDSYQV
eukprot:TRINITY_DN3613_c0_g1_i4.p1 TRINITY_DN3613_c0_g1~~TRINITY_DN3613_c0_g1_i4.p1  ORF type:complete len:1892 (+),score=391.96 TRINITY_DN3613_c0_g1_i4:160-5835(+)